MLNRIITWSLDHRLLVVGLALALGAVGVQALLQLPIDAFPDTTPVQVQVNTVAPALLPAEMEQSVTFPVEQEIAGLPGLVDVRSISKYGFSQVTAIFEEGTDIYLARQLVGERIRHASLPEGIPTPEMGPVATGLGEIFHYIVTGEGWSLRDLTTLHNWTIKPRLLSVPGVAEVNTWGGEKQQFHVLVDLTRLMKHDLSLDQLLEALRENNLSVGGGNLTVSGEMELVHGVGLATDEVEIGQIVISARDGRPILVRDVARIRPAHEIRRGAVTANGEGEVVLGLAFLLMGENSHQVTGHLETQLEEVQKTLPPGVEVRPLYVRTRLVEQVIETVKENLSLGAILVVAVLFAFLGNLRAGLIVASAIPLCMLFAFSGMLRAGIAGSLMSLGAIDFGLIVDSSVILVENSVRRLGEARGKRSVIDVVREASLEVRRPTLFGEAIIMIVYLPVLALEGVEGKLFRPMALTVIFALLGSLILSLTLMPVLTSLLLPRKIREQENWLVRAAKFLYRPFLRLALRLRWLAILGAVALLAGGGWLFAGLGSEFIPRLSEMGIVVNTVRLSGVSLEESVRYGTQIERFILEKFPHEVEEVWVRTGSAEVVTDPMGIELSDVFITLTPRERWKRAGSQEELTDLMRRDMEGLPGMRMIFTQPIEMRVNEMIAGIRADLGVKIFGDDLEVLKSKASEVVEILRSVPWSADVYAEQITGQPVLHIQVDREALARRGIPARQVLDVVEAIGGKKVGEVRQGQRRFDLVVRLDERHRTDPGAVGRILLPTPDGQRVPLARVARIREVVGPSTITREWQRRRIVVQSNARGRDVGGFVEEVRDRIEKELELPPGYHVAYGGQFEHLQRARTRLAIVVPVALGLILLLLYGSTRSAGDALLIFTGAPFATLGGIVALWLRDMPFTISAGVGFVAVSGVAMLNGLVLVSTIRRMVASGVDLQQAIEGSALLRLRPVLMTGLVASLGFIPMALNTGVGAEVQRPLATVVVGGVISDNILTLLVLPALYSVFGSRARREDE